MFGSQPRLKLRPRFDTNSLKSPINIDKHSKKFDKNCDENIIFQGARPFDHFAVLARDVDLHKLHFESNQLMYIL